MSTSSSLTDIFGAPATLELMPVFEEGLDEVGVPLYELVEGRLLAEPLLFDIYRNRMSP